jgi:DNA invertase Pin-like site-specific DNA recombinase
MPLVVWKLDRLGRNLDDFDPSLSRIVAIPQVVIALVAQQYNGSS